MNSPQFKGDNADLFNKEVCLRELRDADGRSLIGLYIAKIFLFTGIGLIILNNLNVVAPGTYFGAMSWVTLVVFSLGLIINFVCIPALYFSSLRNFKKDIEFWDKETFWILPLFFFGTFFLYGAEFASASAMLIISVIVVAFTHLRFTLEAKKTMAIDSETETYSSHGQYFMTLKYLTAYYVLLLVLLVSYNPLQHTFFWIRMNM